MHHFAWWANVVQTFWPVTTYSSPLRTARVFKEARSEPDSGSENPWHHISSALRIGARKRSFWSSVPWAMTVGPPIVSPSTLAICGARARANSSKRIACSICVAPLPPYSVGQVSPAQPRSLSLRCQSRRNWNEASSPSGSLPGWFSAIQARRSSRNSCSAGESVRSTRGDAIRVGWWSAPVWRRRFVTVTAPVREWLDPPRGGAPGAARAETVTNLSFSESFVTREREQVTKGSPGEGFVTSGRAVGTHLLTGA